MDKVEEVPGLYGGVRVEEKVIQRIWSQSAFITDNLVSEEGKKLSILNAGIWNRSEEGPDFRNAIIWIDGEKKFGDVEIHFHERDWKNHGHDRDPNYNQVILHVCLFPHSSSACRIVNSLGKEIPQLSLLPFLYQGLEEYNEEWTLAALSGRDQNLHTLARAKPKNLEDEILRLSHSRWAQKKAYAKKRIDQMSSVKEWTWHDIRAAVATNLAKLGYDRLLIKRVLNHKDTSVTAIYDRYTYINEVRDALQNWADKLDAITR